MTMTTMDRAEGGPMTRYLIVQDHGTRWPTGARLVYRRVGTDPVTHQGVAGHLVAVLLDSPDRAAIEQRLGTNEGDGGGRTTMDRARRDVFYAGWWAATRGRPAPPPHSDQLTPHPACLDCAYRAGYEQGEEDAEEARRDRAEERSHADYRHEEEPDEG